jgi:hypothetical protein
MLSTDKYSDHSENEDMRCTRSAATGTASDSDNFSNDENMLMNLWLIMKLVLWNL